MPAGVPVGRVIELAVSDDRVSAVVQVEGGGRLEAAVTLRPIPARAWASLLRALARKARFAASLLSGLLPADVEALFSEAGHPLLPVRADDLRASCTCGEEACGHLASLHERLDAELAEDPLLIFRLRGRGREQLLAELTLHRGEAEERPHVDPAPSQALPLEPLPEPPEAKPEHFFKPGLPLSSLRTPFTASDSADTVLARLGPPPLDDPEASQLLLDLHRAIGLGAKERLEEWEWRRIGGRG